MRLAVPLVFALVLAALAASAHTADPPKEKEKDKEKPFEFTGRLAPTEQVEVRARVPGTIDKVTVEEGDTVKAGQALAELDARPHKAQFDLARAKLARAEAHLKAAEARLARIKKAVATGTVTKEELDEAVAGRAEAAAGVEVAKAEAEVVELLLAFTKVASPIAGRVLNRKAVAGNWTPGDSEILFTVAPTDPLIVVFEMDERSAHQFLKVLNRDSKFTVAVGFTGEEGFPRAAEFRLLGSRFNVDTGTITARAALPNPKNAYLPGMLVRVRVGLPTK